MFCPSCGAKNADSSKFCETCGASMDQPSTVQAVPAQTAPVYTPAPPATGPGTVTQPVTIGNEGGIYSKIGIVVAVIGIFFFPFGFILGPIGIILGYIGYKKGDIGVGKIAMIVGVVCTILTLLIFAAVLSLV